MLEVKETLLKVVTARMHVSMLFFLIADKSERGNAVWPGRKRKRTGCHGNRIRENFQRAATERRRTARRKGTTVCGMYACFYVA